MEKTQKMKNFEHFARDKGLFLNLTVKPAMGIYMYENRETAIAFIVWSYFNE